MRLIFWMLCLGGAAANSATDRMRVENLTYRPCKAGDREVFQVLPGREGEDVVEEDPKNPRCYLMDVATSRLNFNAVQDLIREQPERTRAMLFKYMDIYSELDFDLSDSKLEPCKRDPKKDPDALRNPDNVCGGFGSCLYCGRDCERDTQELSRIATLEVFKRLIYRRSSRSRPRTITREVNCGGGLLPRDRLFTIRFCPPEEDEFLERLEISKAEWDELFADGKEFYLRAYVVFMDDKIKTKASYVQNLEKQLDLLESAYNDWVDTERRKPGDHSALDQKWPNITRTEIQLERYRHSLKSHVRDNAIACMSVTGNLKPNSG